MIVTVSAVAGQVSLVRDRLEGFRAFGVPEGGPLCEDLASHALGQSTGPCTLIELLGGNLELEGASQAQIVAVGSDLRMEPGEKLRFSGPDGGLAYVCLKGISPNTSLCQGLRLNVDPGSFQILEAPPLKPIVLHRGPHADDELWRLLQQAEFKLTNRLSRAGIRLEGMPLPCPGEIPSEPVCPGVVQLTPEGRLIVLGPDGPTLGGYPKVAWTSREGLGTLYRLLPGAVCPFITA